jgi:hypothetical protein
MGKAGLEFLRIGGFGIIGFLRDSGGFQIEWSEDFRLETFCEVVIAHFIECSSELFAVIVVGSTVIWHMRFLPCCFGFSLECHELLDCRGDIVYWYIVLRFGVATFAACWSIWANLAEAISTPSQFFSFQSHFTRLHISIL